MTRRRQQTLHIELIMGRRPTYANAERKKKARVERDVRIQLDDGRHEEKKRKDREYRQRKREQERLRKHDDPLALLADVATQDRLLEESDDFQDGIQTLMGVDDADEDRNGTQGAPDEDVLGDFADGFADDFDGGHDGMKAISSN